MNDDFRNTAESWMDRLGRRLKLNDLYIFLTVAELGSMGKAAERLSISQPSISKAIADIEHAIGVRLLDRTSRGVELTSYGSTLVKRGMGAFDELRQGIRDIELLNDPAGGEVRVGCSEEIASGLLLEVLTRFAQEYPRVTVNVLPDDYHQKEFYLLRERKVDLCVAVISNSDLDDDLKAETFYKDRPFIVTGRNHRLASKRRVELAELIGEVWLLSHNPLIRSSLATAFRAQGLPFPEVRMRSYSVHQRLNLLAKDGFLAAEFGSILRFNADRYPLRVLPVDLEIGSSSTAAITLKDRIYSPVIRTFIDCIQKVAEAIRYPIDKHSATP